MNKMRFLLLAALVVALPACGGSIRQVQGAQFELGGTETKLADRYAQQEPSRTNGAEARCQYWSRRERDAQMPQQVGMFLWRAGSFPTLIAWTNAKRQQSCSEAQAQVRAQQQRQVVQQEQEKARIAEEQAPPKILATPHDSIVDVLITKHAKPVVNVVFTVQVGALGAENGRFQGTTGADGRASVDISGVTATRELVASPWLTVTCSGATVGPVDLKALPLFAQWASDVESREAAASATARADAIHMMSELEKLLARIGSDATDGSCSTLSDFGHNNVERARVIFATDMSSLPENEKAKWRKRE